MNKETLLSIMTKDRQALHQIPELEFDVFKTKDYIVKRLTAMGYTPKIVAKTGVVAHLKGKSKETIAFRADMDALSVHELTNHAYRSKHPGKMHACGHDGHMALLLGLAEALKDQTDLSHSILFLFQPAEESPGGAKVILDEGVFKTYNVTKVFGMHVFPDLDEGFIGLKAGPVLARSGIFECKVTGMSAHGARPHTGRDSITPSLKLIDSFNAVITKRFDPLEANVISVGTIHGGEARNIVAKETVFSGTIRTFNEESYKTIKSLMQRHAKTIAEAYDVTIDLTITDFYPALINDEGLYNLALTALKEEAYCFDKPLMISEDFAYYAQTVPGLFMLLGSKNETRGFTHSLHSASFDFDERILLTGLNAYLKLLKQMGVLKYDTLL